MQFRLGTYDRTLRRFGSSRFRPAVVAAVAVVALASPMRALADDGWSPSAAQLVQQATSALSTAEQAGLPVGAPSLPDPSAPTTASPDATDSSSTTTAASEPPPATAPVSPATVSDPSDGTSPDGLDCAGNVSTRGSIGDITVDSSRDRALADPGPGNGRRFPRDDRLLVRAGKQHTTAGDADRASNRDDACSARNATDCSGHAAFARAAVRAAADGHDGPADTVGAHVDRPGPATRCAVSDGEYR